MKVTKVKYSWRGIFPPRRFEEEESWGEVVKLINPGGGGNVKTLTGPGNDFVWRARPSDSQDMDVNTDRR